MNRFYCPSDFSDKTAILSDPDELFHLDKVLRLKSGELVELVNGNGGMAIARLSGIRKSSAEFILEKTKHFKTSSVNQITLACAIPKKSKFEVIIEKCTELGVDTIIPLITQRTEINIDQERSARKHERYTRVAINAFKQSKRLWLPFISPPTSFDQLMIDFSKKEANILIPWLEGDRKPIIEAIKLCHLKQNFVCLIGPEGDFTPDEVEKAKGVGAIPLSLGVNTLKVDTAASLVVGIMASFIKV